MVISIARGCCGGNAIFHNLPPSGNNNRKKKDISAELGTEKKIN